MEKYTLKIKGTLIDGKPVDKIMATEEFADTFTAIKEFSERANRMANDFENMKVVIEVVLPVHTFQKIACLKCAELDAKDQGLE